MKGKSMSLTNRLYYASPKPFQELLIAAKAMGMPYKYAKPDKEIILDEGEGTGQQVASIEKMLKYAAVNVPFYSEIIRSKGLSETDININNFKELFPIVTKNELREDENLFTSRIAAHKNIIINTSGTTGQPLRIPTNAEDRARNYKFFNALLAKFDVGPFSKSITIAGKKVGSSNQRNSIYRYDRYSKTLYMSNYDLTYGKIEQYINKIIEFNPEYIDSYPYPIAMLAKYMLLNNIEYSAESLKCILTSSEALTDSDRVIVESVFKCVVVDQYGSAEMAAFAFNIGNEFRFPKAYALVEFIENTRGNFDIVATSSINRGLPMIRYNTGDEVDKVIKDDTWFVSASKLIGRVEDPIKLNSGELLTQFNPVSGVPNIVSAQVIQDSNRLISINIIPKPEFSNEEMSMILSNASLKLGGKAEFICQTVERHHLTRNGKFKFIVNECLQLENEQK
ncbi:MAG: phenylacetate--CoA ligase family protein [Algicola sp.]|nr:phenylacetate--CoA ligase family protein [Algicola sp.]